MSKFDGKSNKEILIDIKEMEIEHETIKKQMLNHLDKFEKLKKLLLKVEENHSDANKLITRRLKGEEK